MEERCECGKHTILELLCGISHLRIIVNSRIIAIEGRGRLVPQGIEQHGTQAVNIRVFSKLPKVSGLLLQ